MASPSRIKALFLDALELPAEERSAFLDEACAGDEDVRLRVERLLAAHDSADDLLVSPAVPTGLVAAATVAPIELKPGDRIGPYELGDELGSGGFGVVFRAQQHEPVRRQVAIKIVKVGMDTQSVMARFELERQVLALLDHPNIARVFDAGSTAAGRPYFVMELVNGVPITEYCDKRRLGIKARVELFIKVARAVQHAHRHGVLHRDIKPSNVLVIDVDGEAQPKVIDFGIAKATTGQLTEQALQTHEGMLLGTPTYMSPEQTQGALDIDTRTDVYSLGVLLYELISGVTPFDVSALGLLDAFQTIREQEPPRPSTRRRQQAAGSDQPPAPDSAALLEVPRELDWVVMRCLEKDRDRRYANAHDLASDGERFLANEPLEAAPPSRWYRTQKLVSRNKTAALAAGGIMAALVLGTIGTSLGLVRADRLNVELNAALDDATDANAKLDAALADTTAANAKLDTALAATESANVELDRSLAETQAANTQVDLALVEARRQIAISEAVNGFLIQDLLGAARPTGEAARGPSTTIGELLDIASVELDAASQEGGRFANEPLVEASLRYTIGLSYDTLGAFAEAARHMQRCVDLRGEVLGQTAHERLTALSYLALIKRKLGALQEAAELQAEAYLFCRDVLGPGHGDTLSAASRLATSMSDVGRTDEAFALLQETLPIAREYLGSRSLVLTDLTVALAILCSNRGRYVEAEELYGEALEIQLEQLGPESPVVLNTKTNLATISRALLKYDASEALYRDVLAVQSRVEGPGHPHTLTTVFNLIECLRSVGRLDEADEIMSESMPAVERAYGKDHRRTFLWLSTRARLLSQQGRLVEAEPVYRSVYERARDAFGDDDPTTLEAAITLARVLVFDPTLHDEVRELLLFAHDGYVRVRGPTHLATLQAGAVLGRFHLLAGELTAARDLLEASYQTSLQVLGPSHPMTTESGASLAQVLASSGDLNEAAALLETITNLQGMQMTNSRSYWAQAAQALAEALRSQGDNDEADRWAQALAERLANEPPPPN